MLLSLDLNLWQDTRECAAGLKPCLISQVLLGGGRERLTEPALLQWQSILLCASLPGYRVDGDELPYAVCSPAIW